MATLYFNRKRGFSLIELLIVIAIITILAAVAMVSYSAIQKRARDNRRRSDLQAIQQAMEQYFADNSATYPAACTSVGTAYLPAGLPTDPKTGLSYSQTCSSGAYCFCAGLEVGSGNAATNCSGTTGTWYCIYNTQ